MSILTMKNYELQAKDLYYKFRNVDFVAAYLNISKEFVINLLTNVYTVFLINDNKFIAISDTHFGSPKENLSFVDYVYNYAIKKGIHYIVHTGDFIEGKSNNKLLTSNSDIQIEEAMKKYPRDNSIYNYLLFGNHDYNALIYDSCVSIFETELNERPDIYTIGLGKACLNWNNKVNITINHEINDLGTPIPAIDYDLNIHGHHHKYQLSNNDLFLPTLSSDIKCGSMPGFTVLELNEDQIEIKRIGFLNNQIFNYEPQNVKILKR